MKKMLLFILMAILSLNSIGCTKENATYLKEKKSSGVIKLYGEKHSDKKILEKEFEIWKEAYSKGNRDLFVELPNFIAGYFNLWIKDKDDKIFDEIFSELKGVDGDSQYTKDFYKKIKKELPETIFHGTDVGHFHGTIGKRYLTLLEEKGLKETEEYKKTLEVIEQGKRFYKEKGREDDDFVYRENKMTENFIKEFDKLKGKDIVGFYGAAHVNLEENYYTTGRMSVMAKQLKKRYGENLVCEDLTYIPK